METFVSKPYKAYVPSQLPLDIDLSEIIPIADKALVSMNKLQKAWESTSIANVILELLINEEAVYSSLIEGVDTNLEDFIVYLLRNDHSKKDGGMYETLNCKDALTTGVEEIKHQILSLYLIRSLHAIQLRDFNYLAPGKYRLQQNYIGSGGGIANAIYIPPAPEILVEHLTNLEYYINKDDDVNPLIKVAIIHAQFEIIHPFLDGNGRIGRQLIPLYLYKQGITNEASFFMSYYLYNNRPKYYENLLRITKDNDWHSWLKYFIKGINIHAKYTVKQIKNIDQHHQNSLKDSNNY